jgi:hypothetical protein
LQDAENGRKLLWSAAIPSLRRARGLPVPPCGIPTPLYGIPLFQIFEGCGKNGTGRSRREIFSLYAISCVRRTIKIDGSGASV